MIQIKNNGPKFVGVEAAEKCCFAADLMRKM